MTILLNLDNVVLAKTGVPVTPNVGLPYMANALRHFGLPDMVNQCFNDPKNSNREIHPYNKILGSTFSLIAGGDKIEDIQKLRADNCLAHAMGFNSIMSPDTFLNFLADCNNTKNLEELNKLICLNALRKSEVQFFTYDNDATYFNSNKKCATYSYKKEKQMSGLLGFIPDLNLCTTADYRTGKVSPKTGVLNQLQDMVALAKEAGKRILNFRSDSAAHSFEIFKYCIKEHINFFISLSQTPIIKNIIESIKEDRWQSLDDKASIDTNDKKNIQWTESTYCMVKTKNKHVTMRILILRWEVQSKEPRLFPEYGYHVIATNSNLPPMQWLDFHNKRMASENYNKEIKNGFAMEYSPSHDFYKNHNYFLISILAYNFVQIFKAFYLPLESFSWNIKKLRFWFFDIAAKFVHHSRQIFCKLINVSDRTFSLFEYCRSKFAFVPDPPLLA